jgi:O-antigen/teichoic acid export membrane protein
MTVSVDAAAGVTNIRAKALSGTRTVAISAVWNLLGRAGPILVAIVATPVLVSELGVTRWGVFTIALSLVGIFGIFDLGVGRALVRSIAERIGAGEEHSASTLVITGIVALAGFGTVGGAFAALGAHFWVKHWLRIDPALQGEVLHCLYVLAFSAPFVLMSAAMWSVIAAYQKFRIANLINIPLHTFYFIGPLLVLRVWDSLVGVMLVLVLCRMATAAIYWWLCRRIMPSLRGARPDWRELGPLLRVGGWMSISNITFPMLMYSDRFIIASVLTAELTAYYTTPFDAVIRMTLVPIAIMTSAYPAMAMSFRNDPANTANLFRRSLLVIVTILFPACLLAASFNAELMATWLGASFAAHAAPVLRWLIVGLLINAVDGAVAGLIDAIGKPDVNAKLSVLELVLSIPILLVLLAWFGIEGAAITWVLRCCTDFILRLFILARLYPPVRPTIALVMPVVMTGIGLLILPNPGGSMTLRVGTDMVILLLYLAVVLRFSLTRDERARIWILLGSGGLRREG